MNVQYVKVFCCRFSWFSVANAFRAVGSLGLEQLSSNKVEMNNGFLHKVTIIVSCQKSCSHSNFLPNSHLENRTKKVVDKESLIQKALSIVS